MKLVAIFVLIHFVISAKGQSPTSVYYASFGSVNYTDNEPLQQAEYSANRMEELLKIHANAKGIKFVSDEEHKITKKTFFQQLSKVAAMIQQDRSANPLIVIYFCGHGFTDTLLNSLFLFSGDFKITPKTTESAALENNIHQTDLMLWLLEKQLQSFLYGSEFRCLFLLDCCHSPFVNDNYNPKRAIDFWGKSLYDYLMQTTTILGNALQVPFQNALAMQDPYIFATSKGLPASVVEYPKNTLLKGDYADTQVGPICRRSLLFLEQMKQQGNASISLNQFIAGITDTELDKKGSETSSLAVKKTVEDCSLFNLK